MVAHEILKKIVKEALDKSKIYTLASFSERQENNDEIQDLKGVKDDLDTAVFCGACMQPTEGALIH